MEYAKGKEINYIIDVGNSTYSPLLANETFVGSSIDLKELSTINVTIKTDVASATNGLKFQYSPDGINWDHERLFTNSTGELIYNLNVESRYFRLVYINGTSNQSYLRITTILKRYPIAPIGPRPSSSSVSITFASDIPPFTFQQSGLSIAGKVTKVTIDSDQWYAFPPTPLANRNALVIQNTSGQDILLNYSNSAPATDGVTIPNGYERQYDITPTIVLYLRRKTGSGPIDVICEELS